MLASPLKLPDIPFPRFHTCGHGGTSYRSFSAELSSYRLSLFRFSSSFCTSPSIYLVHSLTFSKATRRQSRTSDASIDRPPDLFSQHTSPDLFNATKNQTHRTRGEGGPVKLPERNCSSAKVASRTVIRSPREVLAADMVARPLTALAGGRKNENVIVRGVCNIANFTGGRSILSNYH